MSLRAQEFITLVQLTISILLCSVFLRLGTVAYVFVMIICLIYIFYRLIKRGQMGSDIEKPEIKIIDLFRLMFLEKRIIILTPLLGLLMLFRIESTNLAFMLLTFFTLLLSLSYWLNIVRYGKVFAGKNILIFFITIALLQYVCILTGEEFLVSQGINVG